MFSYFEIPSKIFQWLFERTERQIRKTARQKDRKTTRQKDRKTTRQKDRKTERQTDKQKSYL